MTASKNMFPATERNPYTGKFQRVSPLTVAKLATEAQQRKTLTAGLAEQRERVNGRLDRAGIVSRERKAEARKRGLKGPLTRAELADMLTNGRALVLTTETPVGTQGGKGQ